MTTYEELRARVNDEIEARGGIDAVLDTRSGAGECTATALFSIRDQFTEDQFKLVFSLGQLALVSDVFGIA
jgi:hypothetical protein